jgi:tetratricopeptide (TPR) repeat protein
MSTSEIAKLERLWRENRQGFTFAPLAEAYRKMKDTTRALEILAEGMAQRPDYIPASIVLGRCHLDLDDDAQAQLAFQHVLELDSENVIALKALAEISERQGHLGDAADHLRGLLEVDRSNDDARFHLARLETRIAEGDTAPSTADAAADITAVDDADVPEPTDGSLSTTSGVEWLGDAPEDDADIEPDPSIVLQDHLDPPADVEAVGGLEVDDVPVISDASADATAMSGLVGQDFDEHSQGVSPLTDLTPGTVSLGDEDVDDFEPVGTAEDADFHPAASDAADVERGIDADAEIDVEIDRAASGDDAPAEIVKSEELELTASDANEFQVASDAESLMAAAREDEHDAWDSNPDPAAAAETPPPLDTVAAAFGAEALTPTDAGVPDLLDTLDGPDEPGWGDDFTEEPEEAEAPRPGYLAKPATAEQDELYAPPEPELVVTESMAELYRRQGHRTEALAVYRLLYQRHPEDLRLREKVDELETEAAADDSSRPPLEQLTASDPARSVGALLRILLRARPAGTTESWPAETARAGGLAAPGSASEGSPTRPADDHLSLSDVFGDDTSPVPPAVPAAEESAASGVSFDAFFGDTGAPAPVSSRSPSRDDEDLDQFHSWLQNLKR